MGAFPTPFVAALSLTFDDGMDSQLNFAIPEMDRRGLRGTFFLNPRGRDDPSASDSWRKALERWLPVSRSGHEIGNHTIDHPCSLNAHLEWSPHNLRNLTLNEIALNMDQAQARIAAVFPHQIATSFAYPCYESDVGHGTNRCSYVPLVAERFVAGRAKGEYANQPGWCDLYHLSSWSMERKSGAEMIGRVEQVIAQQRWGILAFHGIQEANLSVNASDFIELLDHLSHRSEILWIAPVAEIASWLQVKKIES